MTDPKTANPGDDVPVWWDTKRPKIGSWYPGHVLTVRPYTGPLGHLGFTRILCIEAPGTKWDWLEMTA
jgi:hypothetical protein